MKPYMDVFNLCSTILDIGCGGGFTTNYLRKKSNNFFKKSTVYGIDISSVVIKKAQKKYPKCIFKVAQGDKIPFDDHMFDFAIINSVTVHIPRRFTRGYIKELGRVLKPGSHCLIQLVSFPKLDGIEEDPIFTPAFGPEPHIGWPIEKIFEIIKESNLDIEIIRRRYMKRDNIDALGEIKDYWLLLKKPK